MGAKALVILVVVVCVLGALVETGVAQSPETLRVALYPYVPDLDGLFVKLEAAFEKSHPGVNVELVKAATDGTPLSDNYYSGGLLRADADIYEIDTVLLPDMINLRKIVPLELPNGEFIEVAREAVRFNGGTWAVPHWVCGNFLFYHKDDKAIGAARTWEELAAVFERDSALLLDLKGTSTLGEWYLTALAAADGEPGSILNRLRSASLVPEAVRHLHRLLLRCPAGYCRNDAYHDNVGYYARRFARAKARAYIGYSETLHYALQEISGGCDPTDACRRADEIGVRALPGVGPSGAQVGWVDAFGISGSLTDMKRRLAREFIEFATSWQAYQSVLNPEWPSSPRYLLPALRLSAQKPELDPPLYPALYASFGGRLVITAEGLNDTLRKRGKALDCRLPPERDDEKWVEKCRPEEGLGN